MSLLANKHVVPVLMFHSVGLENEKWEFSHISEPLYLFQKKLECFVKARFNTIFWNDLFGYMIGEKDLPNNSIMLTFDDGYLDNWVFVFPFLRRYGLKATIFVNPEFVDPSQEPRPNLEDVWAERCDYTALQSAGFLSWVEMRAMEASGLVDIQSHSLTHTWYYSGPKIIDFHYPQETSPYPWLFWNKKPQRKAFYITENQQEFVPYGHPVFEHEKALVVRRYFPDEKHVLQIIDYASSMGKDFYRNKGWKEKLAKYSKDITKSNKFEGHYETPNERCERIRKELSESKTLIQKKLNKQVNFICWPGGGYDETVKSIARKVGYKAWTLSSRDLSSFRNLPKTNPENIKRMGTSNRINIKGHGNSRGGAFYQLLNIQAHQNSFLSKQVLRVYKVFSILTQRS
jgi:peptidoglycan/xylan/chitin deacetylase (PgdA/CDA1 family)